ncbi:hypothetical protein D3C86_2014190 [compost metagenome]
MGGRSEIPESLLPLLPGTDVRPDPDHQKEPSYFGVGGGGEGKAAACRFGFQLHREPDRRSRSGSSGNFTQ